MMEPWMLWLGLIPSLLAVNASPDFLSTVPKSNGKRDEHTKMKKTLYKPGQTDFATNQSSTGNMEKTNMEDKTNTVKANPVFGLKVSIRRSKQKHDHCSKRIINICVSYNGTNGQTKKAIVDVKMQTDWIPNISNEINNTKGLQKYEINGNIVRFYFENLDAERNCFNLNVTQETRLRDPKPAYVKIYNNNETDSSATVEYYMKTLCGTKEELPFPTPEEYDRLSTSNVIMQMRVPLRPPVFTTKPGSTGHNEKFQADMESKTNTLKTDPVFDLKVSIRRSKQKHDHCSKRIINICVSYNRTNGQTKNAIVDVKMQTGWIPNISNEINTTKGLQKYEIVGNIVHFYFENLDMETNCFNLNVTQETRLRDPKPAYVKIYNYNETDSSATFEYDLKTICGTKEELPFLTPEEYDSLTSSNAMMQMRVPVRPLNFAPKPESTGNNENV